MTQEELNTLKEATTMDFLYMYASVWLPKCVDHIKELENRIEELETQLKEKK